MLNFPVLKSHLRAEILAGECVVLVSDAEQIVLTGRLFEAVVPYVDGSSPEELCRRLCHRITPAEVYYVLTQLERRGYLTEKSDGFDRSHEAALWEEIGISPSLAFQRIAKASVGIHCVGNATAEPTVHLLKARKVVITDVAKFPIVLTDSYLRSSLSALNQRFHISHKPWLLAKLVGTTMWVGPLFTPPTSGCWECLSNRLRSNLPLLDYLDVRRGQTGVVTAHQAYTEESLQAGHALLANIILRWIAQGSLPEFERRIRTIDVRTFESALHSFQPLPTCKTCGSQIDHEATITPIIIDEEAGRFKSVVRHRVSEPDETLSRFQHHVSSLCGVVPYLKPVSRPEDGVHVYVSGPNVTRGSLSLRALETDLRLSNAGKGITSAQAKASALCESLERFSAVFQGCEPRRSSTLDDLAGCGIAPNDCMLFSDEQFQRRKELNAEQKSVDFVPLPFDSRVELEWTPIWSITRNVIRYLPTAYCWFNYHGPSNEMICNPCSNGNAAGNTLEEAILHGILELIERDSVAIWWYNRLNRPQIRLDIFDLPFLKLAQEHLRIHNRDLWALDLTADFGIPVIAAISRRIDCRAEQILFGFGAHFRTETAVIQAVTELLQLLTFVLNADATGPVRPLSDSATAEWLRTATIAEQTYLRPSDSCPTIAGDFPKNQFEDLGECVSHCASLMERNGLELLVLNQTRSEIGLPVVKVIVPGLRPLWPRFSKGRLYDVPVKMGWLSKPNEELDMNPIQLPL